MTNDKTVTMSRELAEESAVAFENLARRTGDNDEGDYWHKRFMRRSKELRTLLAAPVVERQPEPEAFMYQHDETGQIGFVDIQQVEWGFEKNNPRLKIICPLYRSPPAPVAVVLPERMLIPDQATFNGGNAYYAKCFDEARIWNACLDKVKELNR